MNVLEVDAYIVAASRIYTSIMFSLKAAMTTKTARALQNGGVGC